MNQAALASVVLLSTALGAAGGDPLPPKPLIMQVFDSWSSYDEGGHTRESITAKATLELLPGGKVCIEDQGTTQRSTRHYPFYNAEDTQWKVVWLGTFTMTAQTLVLTIERSAYQCELKGNHHNAGPCPPTATAARLECATTQLAVSAARGSQVDNKSVQEAWLCRQPSDGAAIGGTPLDWAFGKRACVETSPPHVGHGATYRDCSPPR